MSRWLALALAGADAEDGVPKRPKAPKLAPDARFGTFDTFGTALPDLDERAATLEFEAGLSRDWAEALARFEADGPPDGTAPDHWRRTLDDLGRFTDAWATQAQRLGWTITDLIGTPKRPGLLRSLQGRRVVALTSAYARLGDGERVLRPSAPEHDR
jgi:hypothetical protein